MANKFYIKIIIFCIIFIALDNAIGMLLNLVKNQRSIEIGMNEFYVENKNLDLIFLGSSHAYRHFDPDIFDNKLNINSFNFGSSGQNPTTTYFLIKEIFDQKNIPKMIIYDMYWLPFTGEDTDYYSASYVFHSMRFSKNKIGMFFYSFEFPSSLRLFSKTFSKRRNIKRYFTQNEADNEDKNNQNDLGLKYFGKGFVTSSRIVTSQELKDNEFKNEAVQFNDYRISFLIKNIDLIIQNNVQLLAVISPLPPTIFKDIKDYSVIHDKINDLCENRGIELLDFNIINRQYNLFDDKDFMDTHHLNREGVIIFNNYIIDHLKKNYKLFLSVRNEF